MTDVKRLILGIALVVLGMFLVLGSGGGLWPYLGGLLGIIGSFLTLKVIFTGNLR